MYVVFCILLIKSHTCFGQQQRSNEVISGKVFLNLSGGLQLYRWSPEDRKDGTLKFDTEDLLAFNTSGSFGFARAELFSFSYEGLFKNTPHQREMLSTNSVKEKGLEKIMWALNFAPIFNTIIKADNFGSKVLQRVLSVKLKYTKTLYFGEALGVTDFYFVPLDLKFVNNTLPTQAIYVDKGEKVKFKTIFEDKEITFPLFIIRPYSNLQHNIRLGLFETKWERPSDYLLLETTDKVPIVCAYRFESRGFLFGIQTIDEGKEGLNLDWTIRLSTFFKSSITSSYEHIGGYSEDDDEWVSHSSLLLDCWYNMIFISSKQNKDRSIRLTIGGSIERKIWNRNYTVNENNKEEKIESELIESEWFSRFYVKLLFRL